MIRKAPLLALAIALTACPASWGQTQDHQRHHAMPPPSAALSEPGQSVFAAIAEVVAQLSNDPTTDWTKVNIDALRAHLVDMDSVVMRARVAATPIAGGSHYVVTGDGAVADAIKRMVPAHAAMMNGQDGLSVESKVQPDGASLSVKGAGPSQEAKIRSLGFFGLLALGDHHKPHHMMMARGSPAH